MRVHAILTTQRHSTSVPWTRTREFTCGLPPRWIGNPKASIRSQSSATGTCAPSMSSGWDQRIQWWSACSRDWRTSIVTRGRTRGGVALSACRIWDEQVGPAPLDSGETLKRTARPRIGAAARPAAPAFELYITSCAASHVCSVSSLTFLQER